MDASPAASDSRRTVSAVSRTLRVLELLADRAPLTLTDIARAAGIPPASCHAILHTLEHEGYASRRVVGRSHLWEPARVLRHVSPTLVARERMRMAALPHLSRLSDALGMPAHLGVLVGAEVLYVEKTAAPAFVRFDTHPGKRSPFHLTALGRAIAAHLDDDAREALVRGLPSTVRDELAATRRRGYATEDSEEAPGVGCVAAPVRDADGRVLGSVGVTGLSSELFGRAGGTSPWEPVMHAAEGVSADLGGGGAAPGLRFLPSVG